MVVVSVVPIFMSAGAAVLPTVLAGVTTVAAVIFKPRELVRICRERPIIPGVTLLVAVLLTAGVWWLIRPESSKAAKAGNVLVAAKIDWAEIARKILESSQSDRLKPLWTYKLPPDATGETPPDAMFLATPAVEGNHVYIAGCRADVGYVGVLACVDAQTGKQIWSTTFAGTDPLKPFFSSPAITADGKYLVIGQGLHDDHDCSLLCFETATGNFRWGVKTSLHIESSPAIFGDIAVGGAGAIEGKDGKPTGDPGHVIAVRISDGKELWRQPVNDPESSPVFDEDGTVFIGSGFNGNAVVAIRSAPDEQLRDKKLDRIVWKTPVAYPATSAIVLAGDLVIAGIGNSDYVNAAANPKGSVVALDRKTGAIRWERAFDDAVLGKIAVDQNRLICPVRSGSVTALDLATGNVLWTTLVHEKTPVLAGCTLSGDVVFAVSTDGTLAVIDVNSGKLLETHRLNDAKKPGTGLSLCTPRVADGRLFVGSESGGVACFELSAPAGGALGSGRSSTSTTGFQPAPARGSNARTPLPRLAPAATPGERAVMPRHPDDVVLESPAKKVAPRIMPPAPIGGAV